MRFINWFHIGRPRAIFYPVLGFAGFLAACSVDIPVPGFLPDNDRTSAIESPAKILSPHLTAEDWGLARPALNAALAPENAGQPALWHNGATGFGGSFSVVPGAHAHNMAAPADNCRLVRIELSGVPDGRYRTGQACRNLAGEWFLRQRDAET